MPTSLYGPDTEFDLGSCDELPAMIRKSHTAEVADRIRWSVSPSSLGSLPDPPTGSTITFTSAVMGEGTIEAAVADKSATADIVVVAIEAVPQLIASIKDAGDPSVYEGRIKISAEL